jgi:hypothetical protein
MKSKASARLRFQLETAGPDDIVRTPEDDKKLLAACDAVFKLLGTRVHYKWVTEPGLASANGEIACKNDLEVAQHRLKMHDLLVGKGMKYRYSSDTIGGWSYISLNAEITFRAETGALVVNVLVWTPEYNKRFGVRSALANHPIVKLVEQGGWWDELTPEQRKTYLEAHPDSRFNHPGNRPDNALAVKAKAKT